MFKFVSPEKAGYSYKKLTELRNKFNDNNLRIHSLIIAKRNNIFFNVNSLDFNENTIHRMYSQTKSFVSLAIGLLYDDKKIKLTDPISKYFPEYINKNTDKVLLTQTIEDTLKMGTCITCENWFNSKINDRVKLYFNQKHNRKPLEKFEYDSAGSMVLSALVEKITKKDLFTFLNERIFKYLGTFKKAYILKTPNGRTWGDSGLMATTLDMLSIGRFLLNKGKVKNKQLLSEDYIKKATKKYLSTDKETARCKRYGYGYQIWMCKGGYAFLGMGNQITIMYPKLDIVVSMTGNAFDKVPFARDFIFDNLYKYLNHKEEKLEKINKRINSKIDFFINKKIDENLLKNFQNKFFINDKNKLFNKFRLVNKGIIFYKGNKKFVLSFENNKTNNVILKDIFSKDRVTQLPKDDKYNLYYGIEEISDNHLLIQGQIIGDYFAIIKLDILFDKKTAKVSLKTFAENFFNKYNFCLDYKLL